jgi:hypothetical protein
MSEQSGRDESSERPGSERSSAERSGSERSSAERSGSERSSAERSGAGRSGAGRSGSDRQRQSTPASDMLSDLQRWLLRSSARSMRRELGGQVRRTLGGGRQQTSTADVWDTATNEIPPEVGESPECQWCPICRAARRMREAGPGIGGQLSGAGDAVASAVQDAITALDSILSKTGGGDQRSAGSSRPASPPKSASASATAGRGPADSKLDEPRPGAARRDTSADQVAAGRDSGAEDHHASVAGDHGPGGWKPGDRLATEHVVDPDPWAGATEADDGTGDSAQPGAEAGTSPQEPDGAQLDGQGHGPDDRG